MLADNLAKKHTSLVAHQGGRAGTQKAINSQKCELWMCVQFPPKNKEKICKSARTHLAFRASWDTLVQYSCGVVLVFGSSGKLFFELRIVST